MLPRAGSKNVACTSTTAASDPSRSAAARRINLCHRAHARPAAAFTWRPNGAWIPTAYRAVRKNRPNRDHGTKILTAYVWPTARGVSAPASPDQAKWMSRARYTCPAKPPPTYASSSNRARPFHAGATPTRSSSSTSPASCRVTRRGRSRSAWSTTAAKWRHVGLEYADAIG